MADTLLSVLLALGSALCIAIGNVMRQRAASSASFSEAIRDRTWWTGALAGAGGYGLQAAALGIGSLLLVQPLLVLSLMFALPLSARLSGRAVRASDWAWAATLTVAVALLVVVGDPKPGAERAETGHWVVVAVLGIPALALCLLGARSGSAARRALLFGLAGGALFGVGAVLTKSVVHLLVRGPVPLLTSLEVYVLVAVFAAAVGIQQLAFRTGELQASLPATTVTEPAVAALLGFVVLGEYLDVGRGVGLLLIAALVATAVSVVALARGAAERDGAPVRDVVTGVRSG
ncbi:DMT family transporter [Nocardiaceae bacterium NPDC056970]